jgi:3-isopropylmalate/(R)-2-methylmalate dehydratase large subunit
LLHEVTSPQAFEGLRLVAGLAHQFHRCDELTTTRYAGWELGTKASLTWSARSKSRRLDSNIQEFGAAAFFPFLLSGNPSIVHDGPEMARPPPGMTVVRRFPHVDASALARLRTAR